MLYFVATKLFFSSDNLFLSDDSPSHLAQCQLTAKGLTDYGTAKADSVTQQWKEAKCIFLNNVAIVLNTKQRVAKL
jgi:hypothetical protein